MDCAPFNDELLHLPDQGAVDRLVQAEHLDDRSNEAGAGNDLPLLAGQQARHPSLAGDLFLALKREQPKRRKVNAGAVRRTELTEVSSSADESRRGMHDEVCRP